MNELVSVIIPVYNPDRFVFEAIDSALDQSYKNTEIIVVDDGSPRPTQDIPARYGDRIKFIRQENKGTSGARNTGILNSRGEYIAFLDQDDLWLREKLEHQIHFLRENPDIGMVGSKAYNINETGEIFSDNLAYGHTSIYELTMLNSFSPPSAVMVRRSCLDVIGLYDEQIIGCEDKDLWYRISLKYKISILNEPLIKYRYHKSNNHRNVKMMKKNQKRFVDKHLHNWIQRRKAISLIYLDASHESFSRVAKFVHSLVSILSYPFKIGPGDDKYKILVKTLMPSFLIRLLKRT